MTLDEWLYELNKIAVENGVESAMDKEEWRHAYEAGLSPTEAWNSDCWDFY